MFFFCVLGKFGADFASIPMSIVDAFYCIFFCYPSQVLVFYVPFQFCKLNSFLNKFLLIVPIFLVLTVAQYFNAYTANKGHVQLLFNPGDEYVQLVFMNF